MAASSPKAAKSLRRERRDALVHLGACDLRDRIARGEVRVADYCESLLGHIAATEPDVQAWAWLDGDFVMDQARRLDALRATGRPIGPLHGVPVALKDIIDTRRIPTENGTVLDKGRVPAADAFVVDRLKSAGAIVLGKTVTTELAFMQPGKTRNPAAPGHTPGGSSSGSAAAVAAAMAPVALGTQTVGSVIRPASFCGIVGYRPTFGAIPRTGILAQSPSLDTVGLMARSIDDVALVGEVLFGHDAADRASELAPPPRLHEVATRRPPVTPMLAFVRPPGWERADEALRSGMRELFEMLGEQAFEADLPNAFDEAAEIRERIHFAEMAKCYYTYERRGRDQLSDVIRTAIDRGKSVPARDYIAALDWPDIYYAGLSEILERCDAIVTPAALGPAPEGLDTTGDGLFNGLWSLCRTPVVTLPLLASDSGVPMGVQLVGRRGDDGRLLRTARWLAATVAADMQAGSET